MKFKSIASMPPGIRKLYEEQHGVQVKPKTKRGMNKTETRHRNMLELMRTKGEVSAFEFEPLKLRLSQGMYYIPDFMVIKPDTLKVEFHEIKGPFIRDRALQKPKMAAEIYWYFKFWLYQYDDKHGLIKIDQFCPGGIK